MKPIIYWYPEGSCYICEIAQSDFDEDFDEQEHFVFKCCGAGKTPKQAYEDWMSEYAQLWMIQEGMFGEDKE